MLVESQRIEERHQFVHRHADQLGDVPTADLDVKGLLAQARAAAFGAAGLARVARLHHTELYLAPFAVDVVEKLVQPVEMLVAAPQQQLLLGREVVIGLVYREIELEGVLHQLVFPPFHRRAAPAGHGIVVYGLTLVGNHQIFVYADYFAVSLAFGAGSYGVVEAEQMLRRLLELHPVGLEATREGVLLVVDHRDAFVVAVIVSPSHRIAQSQHAVVVGRGTQAIHHQKDILRAALRRHGRHELLEGHHLAADP